MSNKQEVTHPNHWLRDEIPLRAVVWHDAVEEILIVSEAARQMCTPRGSRHARDVRLDAVPTQRRVSLSRTAATSGQILTNVTF